MRFPPSLLDEIRARLPLSQVVGRKVSWDKRKSQPNRGDYWACCPFHGEKSPSFHADDRKGRYHCFGCGVSGDHFTFMVEQEGVSFPEAVEQLAAEAGVRLPERNAQAERQEAKRASLHDVMEHAARFFGEQLHRPDAARARTYLRDRGLGPEILKRFRIGYAPNSRSALKEHLANAGISQEQMVEAGLLIAGPDIAVSYDRFRDRVIFPITDLRGRIIAFGGRALSADAQAKYLNSPETPLFSKGHVLFNGHTARAASRKAVPVIAVEGYIDVITCVAAGFEATVAPLGTALTENQLHLLWQMADEPVLCFDGDDAGLKAAFRALDTALPHLKPGKSLRFALLPGGQDPDDFIRAEGSRAFGATLEKATPMVEMLWLRETRTATIDTPERRAGLEQTLKNAAGTIADQSVRRFYEMAIRERMDAEFGRARNFAARGRNAAMKRGGAPGFMRPGAAEPTGPSASLLSNPMVRAGHSSRDLSLSDAVLLGALLFHPEIAEERLDVFSHMDFEGGLGRLAGGLLACLAENPDLSADGLQASLVRSGHGEALELVMGKLRRTGFKALGPDSDPVRAATIWDDAAHLRVRSGTLSNERQAAAEALGREASDASLIRLRDIQDQDNRTLHPDGGSDPEMARIVHPFKS